MTKKPRRKQPEEQWYFERCQFCGKYVKDLDRHRCPEEWEGARIDIGFRMLEMGEDDSDEA